MAIHTFLSQLKKDIHSLKATSAQKLGEILELDTKWDTVKRIHEKTYQAFIQRGEELIEMELEELQLIATATKSQVAP